MNKSLNIKLLSFLVAVAFIFLAFLQGCSYKIYPSKVISPAENCSNKQNLTGKLTLNGSSSMTKLCNALGESFVNKNPETTVEKSDTGSGSAVKSILEGTALIGDLSRNLNENEKRENIKEITIALDSIAVVVNKKNMVDGLSKEAIAKIFKGEIKNWAQVGGEDLPITLIGREESSGTRDGFESALNINNSCQYNIEYPESGDIVSKVNNDKNAIGYCSLFSVSGGVKAVMVDGVLPDKENTLTGKYTIVRPFVEIFRKETYNDLIKEWFVFVNSDVGKEIIEKEKLVPVSINDIQ